MNCFSWLLILVTVSCSCVRQAAHTLPSCHQRSRCHPHLAQTPGGRSSPAALCGVPRSQYGQSRRPPPRDSLYTGSEADVCVIFRGFLRTVFFLYSSLLS